MNHDKTPYESPVLTANLQGDQIRAIDSWLEDDVTCSEQVKEGRSWSWNSGRCGCETPTFRIGFFFGIFGLGFTEFITGIFLLSSSG